MSKLIIGNNNEKMIIDELDPTFVKQGSIALTRENDFLEACKFFKSENYFNEMEPQIKELKEGTQEKYEKQIPARINGESSAIILSRSVNPSGVKDRIKLKDGNKNPFFDKIRSVDLDKGNEYSAVFSFVDGVFEVESRNKFQATLANEEIVFDDNNIKETLIIQPIKYFEYIQAHQGLTIPPFQRTYSWTSTQVIDLLEDIKKNMNGNKRHFLGNVVVIDNKVIDGQQRLTTLYMLLIILGVIKYDDNVQKPLRLRYQDEDTLHRIVYDFDHKIDDPGDSIVAKNYKLMYEWVEAHKADKEEILKVLSENIILSINTFSSNLYDEVELYSSLNTRGLELNQYDLIKSILFKNRKVWTDEDCTKQFNNFEKSYDSKNNMTDYFRYYLVMTKGIITTKKEDSSKNNTVSKKYDQYLRETYGVEKLSIQDFQDEIAKADAAFRMIKKVMEDKYDEYELSPKTIYLLKWLKDVTSKEIIPLLACILMAEETTYIEAMVTKAVEYTAKFLFKNGSYSSYIFDKITMQFYEQITNDKNLCNESVLNKLFRNDNIDKNKPRFAMDVNELGNYNFENANATKIFKLIYILKGQYKLDSGLDVEHILPQDLHETDVDKYPDHEEYVKKIGNMFLLERTINSSINNLPVKYKINSNKEQKKSYRDSEQILVKEFMEQYGDREEWTEKDIIERSKQIRKEVFMLLNDIK